MRSSASMAAKSRAGVCYMVFEQAGQSPAALVAEDKLYTVVAVRGIC
jgi:hypothetical protein